MNPAAIPPLRRRDAPEQFKDVQYLVRGHFCVDEDSSGCNDIRWVGVKQMKQSGLEEDEVKESVSQWARGIIETLEAEWTKAAAAEDGDGLGQ